MREVYMSGRLVERWDTTARTYTRWNADGSVAESRPFTAEENARADAAEAAAQVEANRRTIEQAVANALDQNRTIVSEADAYLAGQVVLGASPTNAQVVAAVKAYGQQVAALTTAAKWAAQQRNGLIRLALDQLDATD